MKYTANIGCYVTPGHLNFSGCPTNLRITSLLLSKQSLLEVSIVVQDEVHDLLNGSRIVQSSIYVVDRNQTREPADIDLVLFNVVGVDE
jgi:hypothetical protein